MRYSYLRSFSLEHYDHDGLWNVVPTQPIAIALRNGVWYNFVFVFVKQFTRYALQSVHDTLEVLCYSLVRGIRTSDFSLRKYNSVRDKYVQLHSLQQPVIPSSIFSSYLSTYPTLSAAILSLSYCAERPPYIHFVGPFEKVCRCTFVWLVPMSWPLPLPLARRRIAFIRNTFAIA